MTNHNHEQQPGAIVTGASRGIGAAIAIRLAADGHAVCVNYLRSKTKANEVVARIEADGGRAFSYGADVGDYGAVERMVAETVAQFGGVRTVVNNAGLSEHRTLDQMSIAEWDRSIAVNLSAAMFTVKAALAHLKRESWGRVVNICSLRAMIGSDHGSQYAAAKSGLIGLTKSLALELAPSITVNAISPGYTRTDMTKEALEKHAEKIFAKIPAARAAEPDEMASLVSFLASEAAGYITGQTINANGGLYM